MAASPSCLQRSCGDQASMLCNTSGTPQQAPSVTPSTTITGAAPLTKELISSDESITTAQSNESLIDSALISALSDPRERVALLRCEQHFVTFLQSPDITEILVGGSYNSIIHGLTLSQQQPANAVVTMPGVVAWNNQGTFPSINSRPTSFQRCWLHRLADRFGIVRESVNTEWIKCQKTSQSAMPAQLLCNHVDEKTPKGKRPNKMKIMKRNSSSSSSLNMKNKDNHESRKDKSKIATSTSSGTLKRTSLSDKEKAYAEARARIFHDESDGGLSSCIQANSNFTTTTTTTSPPTLSNSPTPDTYSEEGPIASTTHNWTTGISKVTWRNRQEEENDPDFQRGVLYSPQDMAYYYQTQAQLQPKKEQNQQLQQPQQQQFQLPIQYQGSPSMYYYNPSFSNDFYRSTPTSRSAPPEPGGYPSSS
jgi:hypothetical protein